MSEPDFVIDDDKWFEASQFYSPFPLFNKDFQDDFGVIKLPSDVPSSLLIDFSNEVPADEDQLTIAGFPGGSYFGALFLATASGNVTGFNPNNGLVNYGITTYTGNSGGPVFAGGVDGVPYSFAAIHVGNSLGRAVRRKTTGDNAENSTTSDPVNEVKRLIDLIDGRT